MSDEPFIIRYAQDALADVKALRAHDQRKVLDAIDSQLHHNPTQVSRKRIKAMRQPFWSQYRLRVEDFRVYYDVDHSQRAVSVLRVLEKGQGQTPQRPDNETDRTDS
jgi:mRNA interferase RelE/StbE